MKLTIILAGLCIAGFAAGLYIDYDSYGFSLNNLVQNPLVFFTSLFIHGSLEHLLSNLLVLLFFGAVVEKELGWRKMLVIFILGAAAGDLVAVAAYPGEIAIGASAAIFALIGAAMFLPPDMSMPAPIPAAVLGIAYALYNVYGMFAGDPNVAYEAHFGGFLAGLALGYFRYRK